MAKFEVGNAKGLGELNAHLADKSYVNGYTPSNTDAETFKAMGKAPEGNLPHVTRWFNHINSYTESERAGWTAHVADVASTQKKGDDFDLFAEDDEAELEREKEIQRRADEQAAKKKAAAEASGKVAAVMKSAVVIDVKPWEDTTDMAEMEKLVRGIEMEGLEWKASKLVPIGYGIKKLQISCHIVDEIVSVDDIQDKIAEFADHVQSTDVVTFTKL